LTHADLRPRPRKKPGTGRAFEVGRKAWGAQAPGNGETGATQSLRASRLTCQDCRAPFKPMRGMAAMWVDVTFASRGHKFEAIDVEEAEVGDLQMGNDRKRQERDL
jgi:hypothetical protein